MLRQLRFTQFCLGWFCAGSVWLAMSAGLQAHESAEHAAELTAAQRDVRDAAVAFVKTLDEPARGKALFQYSDAERLDWHFIPRERNGLTLKEMSLEQRRAAHDLLRATLSEKGYLKATTIMSLEQVLRVLEQASPDAEQRRDQERYWFSVFGDPAGDKPWGWRVEGHHLSLNFSSIVGHPIASQPLFLGANPAEVRSGPRAGLRALGQEEDLARELMHMLEGDQRQTAMIATEAPADVLTVPGAKIDLGAPAGIAASAMNKEQRQLLMKIVRLYATNLREDLSAEEMKEIRQAGVGKIHFGWAGSIQRGEGHYYRIHGPTFIIEYDNTQNEANHVHAVWHSLTNDFDLETLQRHYASPEHQQGASK
jgi:hypothetical protein